MVHRSIERKRRRHYNCSAINIPGIAGIQPRVFFRRSEKQKKKTDIRSGLRAPRVSRKKNKQTKTSITRQLGVPVTVWSDRASYIISAAGHLNKLQQKVSYVYYSTASYKKGAVSHSSLAPLSKQLYSYSKQKLLVQPAIQANCLLQTAKQSCNTGKKSQQQSYGHRPPAAAVRRTPHIHHVSR